LRKRNFRARVFDPAAAAIGVPQLTPHDLLHTAASLAVRAWANCGSPAHAWSHLPGDDLGRLLRSPKDDLDYVA
jgi:hypothetical protein